VTIELLAGDTAETFEGSIDLATAELELTGPPAGICEPVEDIPQTLSGVATLDGKGLVGTLVMATYLSPFLCARDAEPVIAVRRCGAFLDPGPQCLVQTPLVDVPCCDFFVNDSSAAACGAGLCSENRCAGDCDADGHVGVTEVVRLIAVALLKADPGSCPFYGVGKAGAGVAIPSIQDIIESISNSLHGCP